MNTECDGIARMLRLMVNRSVGIVDFRINWLKSLRLFQTLMGDVSVLEDADVVDEVGHRFQGVR